MRRFRTFCVTAIVAAVMMGFMTGCHLSHMTDGPGMENTTETAVGGQSSASGSEADSTAGGQSSASGSEAGSTAGGQTSASGDETDATGTEQTTDTESSTSAVTINPEDLPEKQGTEYASLKEAEDVAGFTCNAAKELGSYKQQSWRAVKGSLLEIDYSDGTKQITLRKAAGEEDTTGFYPKDPDESDMVVKNVKIYWNEIGDSDDDADETVITVAVWKLKKHSYALYSEDGISPDTLIDTVWNLIDSE